MTVSVAIDLALDRLFTYEVPVELSADIRVGQLLRVPFGHRIARGFAMRLDAAGAQPVAPDAAAPVAAHPDKPAAFVLKPILGIEDPAPFFAQPVLELVKWIAAYTASPLEACLKSAVPAAVLKADAHPRELLFVNPLPEEVRPGEAVREALSKRQRQLYDDLRRVGGGWMQQVCREFATTPGTVKALAAKGWVTVAPKQARRNPLAGRRVLPDRPLDLNAMQRAALDVIVAATKPVLLHGVTGSGKTEIYLQAIAAELAAGRGAIVLVPEIALTPQTVYRFARRFGDKVAVLHSALSDGERYDEWHRIRTGAARVVVGPRSAVFAPVRDLGLIVVDEEHDGSYKQDETPRYHARDVAVMRGHFEGCRVVLGSATPSLESWLNAKNGKYRLAEVPARVAGRSMPSVRVVNLDEESMSEGHVPIFSKFLLDAIADRLRNGEQTILFLNRRGYSRVLECKTAGCGYVATCPECEVPYTYHQADDCLRCHICGGWMRVPRECPECHHRDYAYTGIGTQRAEAALRQCFRSARILRMDADSTSRRHSHDDILGAFKAREADILIGTQMIAKGLDFPNVTLVGVLNADTSLHMPDFRAGERTYQLLAQVCGRAGRAEKPGEAWIQTFSPDEYPIQAAVTGDFAAFAERELAMRREGNFPPYCRLATLLFKSQNRDLAASWCALYAQSLAKYPGVDASMAGPAALEKAEGWYRYQIVLRAAAAKTIVAAVRWIRRERPVPKDVRMALDVDAISLL